MHILLIHQAYVTFDEAGGTRHHEIANYLVQHGHQVTVIASPISYLTGKSSHSASRWQEHSYDTPKLKIIRCYTYPALHRSFIHRVFSFLSFMLSSFFVGLTIPKIDLVWGTSPPIFQGFTAWLLAQIKRVPFLFEVRDLWPAFAIEIGVLKNPMLINASLWLERFLYTRSNQVVVNSPGYIDHVKNRGAARVSLIPNGADPNMFNPDSQGQRIREKYGLESKFLAVYAGAHGMSNDLGVILHAAKLLLHRKDIAFLLVGDGKEKIALQEQAQLMALSNVTFIPPIAKLEMAEILAAAGVCIAILKPIELYKTTYPNKVFDYMAAGRPIILAIDGVIRKVVEEASAGIPVPPGNAHQMAQAIEKLCDNPKLCEEMGKSGRFFIEQNFRRSDLAARFTHLLESMYRGQPYGK